MALSSTLALGASAHLARYYGFRRVKPVKRFGLPVLREDWRNAVFNKSPEGWAKIYWAGVICEKSWRVLGALAAGHVLGFYDLSPLAVIALGFLVLTSGVLRLVLTVPYLRVMFEIPPTYDVKVEKMSAAEEAAIARTKEILA